MANGLKFSPRKTALALAVAVVCAWQSPVFAHGSEAHMVPLDKTLQEFGADVQWDDYAQIRSGKRQHNNKMRSQWQTA
ncbi:hypothetical protein CKQ90_29100 [Klebsiella pneumoniae]|nr:hypothetical protein CKQ90_29100 [Klebsiella pneumoniae]